jgi:hypothetical protein
MLRMPKTRDASGYAEPFEVDAGRRRARQRTSRARVAASGEQLALLVLHVLLLALGCPSPASPPPLEPPPGTAALTRAPPPAPVAPAPAPPSESCRPFECRVFETGAGALAFVLEEQPLALGVGEAHALAGSEQVVPAVRRFTEALLPALRGRATHLVVELLAPDPRCEAATREVRRAQKPVTERQSAHNQNDYVALGQRARELGVEPFVLSPSCDEYRAIADAGDAAIDVSLATIAKVSSRMLRGALAKNHAAGSAGLVVGYGGALHNDIQPAPEKAGWSYGPELAAASGGRYVELDLIVREFIKDTDVWKALPWYAHFDPQRDPSRWLVMRTAPHSYVLFFPATGAGASGPAPP